MDMKKIKFLNYGCHYLEFFALKNGVAKVEIGSFGSLNFLPEITSF